MEADWVIWVIVILALALMFFVGMLVGMLSSGDTHDGYCKGAGFDSFGDMNRDTKDVQKVDGMEVIRCTKTVLNADNTADVVSKWIPYRK